MPWDWYKFNAFPYQRYGLIDGTLEFISPAARPSVQTKHLIYEGCIRLDRDYYEVAGRGGGSTWQSIRSARSVAERWLITGKKLRKEFFPRASTFLRPAGL